MKHRRSARALSALVVVAGLTAAALAVNAQTPPPGGPGSGNGMYADRVPASDAEFVRLLDASNTAELEVAKYVVNRTKDPGVHQFAQRLIDDHSSAAVALEAATRGTNLRPTPRDVDSNGMGRRMIAVLSNDDGPTMDNDFMRMQVPMHRRTLGLLQWESANGQNNGLKALADKLSPTVQQHMQIAQSYLAAHNLTPYTAPMPNPVPGHPNPGGAGAGPGPGTPNNPASGSNGGSTSGNNNGTGGTTGNPVVAPTYAPLGGGTPAPGTGTIASPAPVPSPTRSP